MVGGSTSLIYYCITFIPISTLVTVYNTGPIFIFFIEAIAHKVPPHIYRNPSTKSTSC